MKHVLLFVKKYIYVLLVLASVLLATFPLFHAGLMPTHDGEYHLIRFYEFDTSLRQGNLYPRWAPDLNFSYGIPLLTYVYPLPNYAASLFHAFGASFLDSVKLDMIASSLMGAWFFYLWAKKFWGNAGGLVSSVLYTFAPYHFVDMYVRGSVGEVMALGVFPGFLWAYTLFVDTKKPLYFLLSIILLSFTVFSHNIVGLMFFIFAISYMVLLILLNKQKKLLISSICIIILSLCLSAIFWLPALLETKYVTGLQIYEYKRNFPDVFQLLFPSWGTGFFDSNLGDQMSVQIGIANLLGILLAVISFFVFVKRKKRQAIITGFFLMWFAILFFLMLKLSLPVWQHVPLINYFQFPWRFLSLVILICSFLAGSILFIKPSKILTGLLLFIAVATTISYTYPAYYMMRNDAYYTSRSNFIDSTNSPGNAFNTIWGVTQTERPKELFITGKNSAISFVQKNSATDFTAILIAKEKTKQTLSLSYFPMWRITLDGKEIPISQQQGLVTFTVPEGKHAVHIFLALTYIEKAATAITTATALILFAIFLLRKKISTLRIRI